jgi:hypothetical protein
MKIKQIIILLINIFIFSCVSDQFLLNNLSQNEKSNLIVEKGINKYNEFIADPQDLTKLDSIKQYFEIALQYNQNNAKAKDYLNKVNSFKEIRAKQFVKNAAYFKNIAKRSERDDFYMCYNIEKALEIDPLNKEALSLKNEIKNSYNKLIKSYMDRGEKAKEDAAKENNSLKKKKLIFYSIDNFTNILLLEPSNAKAKSEKADFESSIKKDMQTLISKSNDDLNKSNFTSVRNNIPVLREYNKYIDNKMDKEVNDLEYTLNYKWAEFYYKSNKMDLASNKITIALSIKKSNESLNLNKLIQDKRTKQVMSVSFDTNLESIDDLINDNQLTTAKQKIDYLYKSANPNQKKLLDAKINQITQKLDSLYDDAVNDYNNENFKIAIQKFGNIININKDFKDASKYYDKAVEKQKTLDSF